MGVGFPGTPCLPQDLPETNTSRGGTGVALPRSQPQSFQPSQLPTSSFPHSSAPSHFSSPAHPSSNSEGRGKAERGLGFMPFPVESRRIGPGEVLVQPRKEGLAFP